MKSWQGALSFLRCCFSSSSRSYGVLLKEAEQWVFPLLCPYCNQWHSRSLVEIFLKANLGWNPAVFVLRNTPESRMSCPWGLSHGTLEPRCMFSLEYLKFCQGGRKIGKVTKIKFVYWRVFRYSHVERKARCNGGLKIKQLEIVTVWGFKLWCAYLVGSVVDWRRNIKKTKRQKAKVR